MCLMEVEYTWVIDNPKNVKKFKEFLEKVEVNQVKYDESLYEVSMYE